MLRQMRTGAQSKVLKTTLFGMLLLAFLGLAMMDVTGAMGNKAQKNYVAQMDGQKISTADFDRLFRNQIRAQDISVADAYNQGIPFQVLKQEMNMRLFSRAVYDLGLRVDDKTVAKEIKRQLAPMLSKNMSEKDALKQALNNIGMSEKQLVSSLKNQMAGDLFVNVLMQNASVPDRLVSDALKLRYETRKGIYVTVDADDLGKVGEPTEEDLQKTYEQMKPLFMKPEYRSFAIATFDKKAMGLGTTKITDADVQAYYDAHKDEFKLPETRALNQVITQDEATAQKIAEAAKGGADLKSLAIAEKAKATYLAKDYDATGLPSGLSEEVFKAEPKALIGPIKTDFGWHVAILDKVYAPHAEAFAEVKDSIKQKLTKDNGASALYDKANAIDDSLSNGKKLADVAAEYNVKEVVVGPVDAQGLDVNGKKPGTAIDAKALQSVFALDAGETSQLIETADAFILAETRDITPAAAKPLADIRGDVVKGWKMMQQSTLVEKKTAELNEKIKLGQSFDKVIEGLGKPQTTKAILRSDSAEKSGISRGIQNVLFTIDSKDGVAVFPEGDRVTVIKLTERKLDVPAQKDDKTEKAMQDMLVKASQNDLLDQYGVFLADKYDAKMYPEVIDQLYAPKDGENLN